jgi:hypothetical protein
MADDDKTTAPSAADDTALLGDVLTSPLKDSEITPQDDSAPKPPIAPEPTVPAGRLREEAERARKAEGERDDLRRRMDEFMLRQAPPQKPEPPKRSDVFEAPSAFVQEEVKPLLDPLANQVRQVTEHYSQKFAHSVYGEEKVNAAYKALDSAMGARDPEAWSVYNRAMSSIDPYGEIMKWHNSKEIISTVGPDVAAYRQKILDEALKDPEFQKKVFEAARGQAQSNNNTVNRVVPKIPSIGKVGAAQIPEADDNASDDELFQATTRRQQR